MHEFLHKIAKFKEIPCFLGAALARAHHGKYSFSSAFTSKPKWSLESSDLAGNITVLPDPDNQGLEQPR